jgi:hypothetical protein
MNKDRVKSIIDNRLYQLFMEGYEIDNVTDELKSRCDKFFSILEKEEGLDIVNAIMNPEMLNSTRMKYAALYVISGHKRLKDLDWMEKNRHKFLRFNNQKFFRLVQLRDRMVGHEILTF